MTETFYQALGVPEDASTEEIRSAYRERAREVHPDRNDDPRATERMKRLNRARDVLTDGSERERYDRLGHEAYVDAGVSGSRSPDDAGTSGGSRGTSGDRSGTTGESNTPGGSSTGGDQGGGAWNPWSDPFGDGPLGGDPFDGEGSFGGDPFRDDGPLGGDPFDRDGPFGAGAPFGGTGTEGDWKGGGPTAGTPGGRSTGWTAGDGRSGRARRGTSDDTADGWVGDYRNPRETDADRSGTTREVEWSDGGEDHHRVDPGVAALLADRIRPRSPDSTVARAWSVRVVASALLAGIFVWLLGIAGGSVEPAATLLASLSSVLVVFLGYEVVADRSPVGPDAPGGHAERSGSRTGSDDGGTDFRPGSDDGDVGSRPGRRPERAVAVAVGTNLLAAALMLLGAARGGDWFGLAYAGRVTVEAVVLFLVVAPTAGVATGTLLASVLAAVLGRSPRESAHGVGTVGLAAGLLVAYAGTAVVFFTRLGGRRGSVREPLGGGASGPWLPAVEAGPFYLGGTLEFLLGVALVGCLAVSWLLFLGVAAGLPRYDSRERGYRVWPVLWDLGVALPVTSLVWAWVVDVRTFALRPPASIGPVPLAWLPREDPLLTGTFHVAWVLFAVCSLPASIGAAYLVRRRVEERLRDPAA